MKVRLNYDSAEPPRPHWWFWCPGCEDLHMVGDSWEVALPSDDRLTVHPSILTWNDGHYVDGVWDATPWRCHSFIRSGNWEFLGDCTHALAGQTVPMVDIPVGLFEDEEDCRDDGEAAEGVEVNG